MTRFLQIFIILSILAPVAAVAQVAPCDPMPATNTQDFTDWSALDCDGDGVTNVNEQIFDTDGDGLDGYKDLDTDNDGILDALEGITNSDNDPQRNLEDLDSDNDAIGDEVEAHGSNALNTLISLGTNFGAPYMVAGNNYTNGNSSIPDFLVDTDGDGIRNFLDPSNTTFYSDRDNDGVIDLFDDTNNNPTLYPSYTAKGVTLSPNNGYIDGGVLNPLPVNFIHFTAIPANKKVTLTWETAQEINNHYFQIERSADGRTFTEVSRLAGNGNSTSRLAYQFTDIQPLAGTSYYRLRQVDFDGTASYSPTVVVRLGKSNTENAMRIYPTLVQEVVSVQLEEATLQPLTVAVYDLRGSLFYSEIIGAGQTQADIQLPLLPAGLYMVSVIGGETHVIERIIKQ